MCVTASFHSCGLQSAITLRILYDEIRAIHSKRLQSLFIQTHERAAMNLMLAENLL